MIEQKSLEHQIIQARILYYDFFAHFFLYELLEKHQTLLIKQTKLLMQYPLKESDIDAFETILQVLQEDFPALMQEYTKLFLLSFEGDVSLYLSSYQEECIGGKSLVSIRQDLKECSLMLNLELCKEYEDHLALLCLFNKYLLRENQGKKANAIYAHYIHPMKDALIASLFKTQGIYACVARVFESFCMLEDSICNPI